MQIGFGIHSFARSVDLACLTQLGWPPSLDVAPIG